MPGPGTAPGQSSAPTHAAAVAPDGPAAPAGDSQGGRRRAVPGWLPALISGLAGFAFGAYRVGVPTLWRDEGATIEAARRSVPQIFALLHHVDAVTGVYYLFMHPVIVIFGTSETAVRLPSVLAMAIAAALVTAMGRRLAELAGLPAPALTGLLAGLIFTTAPQVTRYAQEARAYAIVTMLAALASYLLLRALADDRWRWWAGYASAALLGGLFNTFAVLLIVAHGVTLLLTRAGRDTGRPGAVTSRQLTRWAAMCAVAVAGITPVLAAGYLQRVQIAWLTKPDVNSIVQMAEGFAGSSSLVLPVALTAILGVAAGLIPRWRHALTPGMFALPWLVLPALILNAVSLLHPVFTPRYVLYSQPALALLCAAGLAWLADRAIPPLSWLTRSLRRPRLARPLAWLPAAFVAVVMAVMLAGPQRDLRLPYSNTRVDNLRGLSQLLAASERPGDAVFYFPINRRIMDAVYSGPFQRLDDVALAKSPAGSATLAGTEVSPATLTRRFTGVHRVWVIALSYYGHLPPPPSGTDREKLALLGRMHLTGRWWEGAIIVCLYSRA